MRVDGCTLADTKGARKCPHCGERHLQKIHSVNSSGRPLKVECPVCRQTWQWPTVAEDERKRIEDMRRHSREYYVKHRDEILAREHRYKDYLTAKAKDRRHRKRAHLHPKRTCPVCGTQFVALHGGHKYCSSHCRDNSPDRARKNRAIKDRTKKRNAVYIAALESVALSVGMLDECKRTRDEVTS